MPGVLVIDDDPSLAALAREAVSDLGLNVVAAHTGASGYTTALQQIPDVILLEVALPDEPGLSLFERLHALDVKIPMIVVTAGNDSRIAIEAMRLGAFDLLLKPIQVSDLRQCVQRLLETRALTTSAVEIRAPVEADPTASPVLVGRSAPMQQVCKAIGRLATQDVTVLVRGESGVGKELTARLIHQYSRRAAGPFVALNCVMASEVEAELLGEQRASSTKADRARQSCLQRSAGGTLFLDEVAELSLSMQSALVNLLVDQASARGNEATPPLSEVRVIAATSRDLSQLLATGQFRADLFYHLNATTIEVPPLRERLDDLPALVNHYLLRHMQQLKKRVSRLAPQTLEALRRYPWPGNVRELEGVLREALLNASGPVLLPEFLPAAIRGEASATPAAAADDASTDWNAFVQAELRTDSEQIHEHAVAQMEMQLLTLVLKHTDGHQARAAKLLGITRTSLRSKLRALGIVVGRTVDVPAVEEGVEALRV
ncbi:MAG: sigma-54-dependent Fis family transcriptional regulator [Planctomycetes bacterium]|nr:sigma-54-dependent Fis family transcriptional regulator [Planctomycetota bacterium]